MSSTPPPARRRPTVPGAALLALLALSAGGAALRTPDTRGEAEAMKATRPCVLAGSWYPADAPTLAASVDAHIARGRPLGEVARRPPLAAIVPHAGHEWSGDAAGHIYRLLEGGSGAAIRRVILLGPAHYQGFRGASLLGTGAYATPLGEVPLDVDAARALQGSSEFTAADGAHLREHCLEIQLPFLQRALRHPFRIVPILVSRTDADGWGRIADAIAPWVDDSTLVLISSDFTHFGSRFGYLPFRTDLDANLRRLDRGALLPVLALDPDGLADYERETEISVCGIHPIGILLRVLGRADLQRRWGGRPEGRVLEYYRSADRTGDFDGSVSYASVAFFRPGDLLPGPAFPELLGAVRARGEAGAGPAPAAGAPAPMDLTPEEKRFLLDLARRTLREVLAGRPAPGAGTFPAGVSAEKLRAPSGVFVTLTEGGALRGCIGSIVGTAPLAQGVIENAIHAALEDPRFPPVAAGELARLEIEISVLTPLRPVARPEEIVVGRDGVVLERGGRRAVFLPQVAPEQGWDRETMLDQLAQKAGLPRDAWRSGASFQVFEARVFSEEEFEGRR